jgi:4-nitrophenyl phosphatase
MLDFSRIDGVISDMDGVLWHGDTALPGMVRFFELVNARRLPVALATNNSSKSEAEYVAKLRRLGVGTVGEDSIITSRRVTVEYLTRTYPAGTGVFVVGTPGLEAAISAAGFAIDDRAAGVVVVGIDPAFSYDKLKRATLLVRAGAHLVGTNGDAAIPSAEGMIPGNGSLLAAIETASGEKARVLGKPAPAMYETALRAVGTPPARTLMIGDRIDTDMTGARRAGMMTALVLSGATDDAAASAATLALDAIYPGLERLVAAWAAA